MPAPTRPLRERFLDKVLIGDDCWEWTAAKHRRSGYGSICSGVRGQTELAHRASYELFIGPVPDGMCVCHTCDNPGCVKPGHLFLGTYADNLADMDRKGRRVGHDAAGELNGNAKLDESDVSTIRQALEQGAKPLDLAALYGVTGTCIGDIKRGKTWRHSYA